MVYDKTWLWELSEIKHLHKYNLGTLLFVEGGNSIKCHAGLLVDTVCHVEFTDMIDLNEMHDDIWASEVTPKYRHAFQSTWCRVMADRLSEWLDITWANADSRQELREMSIKISNCEDSYQEAIGNGAHDALYWIAVTRIPWVNTQSARSSVPI